MAPWAAPNEPEHIRFAWGENPVARVTLTGSRVGLSRRHFLPASRLDKRRTDTSILTTRPVLWDRALTSRFGGGRIATCRAVQAVQG